MAAMNQIAALKDHSAIVSCVQPNITLDKSPTRNFLAEKQPLLGTVEHGTFS